MTWARRVLLAGNGDAAIATLDLLREGWPAERLLTVAPADSPRHSWQGSLRAAARERGVHLLDIDDINAPENIARIGAFGADLALSVYYTEVFRAQLIAALPGASINFHPSLLPRHRGVAPLIWAIAEGDTMTGVSAHYIDEGIDTGKLIAQRKLPIHPEDTGYELHQKAANLVRSVASEILRTVRAGEALPPGVEQTGPGSYNSRSDPALNHLDWTLSRERIRNVIRALAPPLPGAFTLVGNEQVVICRVSSEGVADPPGAGPKPPGMLEYGGGGKPVVWAADGPLVIEEVMHEGECRPATAAFDRSTVAPGSLLA